MMEDRRNTVPIQMEDLADHIDCIPLLSMWLYAAWHDSNPHGSMEDITCKLAGHLDPNVLPLTLLAMRRGRTMGTVSLVCEDVHGSTTSGSWLSLLYVDEEQRKQGIGSALVCAAEERARALGKSTLYLCTLTPSFYERLGWEVIDQQPVQGAQATVMRRTLNS